MYRRAARVGNLSLEVLPALGAKVVSLRYGGHPEWLAQPVRRLRVPSQPAGAWGNYDCSGWDECMPNVGATSELPDHGMVWSREWFVSAQRDRIVASIDVANRFQLQRELLLTDTDGVGTLVASYRIQALGDQPLTWGWAQHPLLAADPSTMIVLPEPARVRVDSAFVDGQPVADAEWLCPGGLLAARTDLGKAHGRAAKLWFGHPLPSFVAIVRASDVLVWRIDQTSASHLGLWVNGGGWGALPRWHVAVEPSFGAHDDFDLAQRAGAGLRLHPGDTHAWRVVLQTTDKSRCELVMQYR